MKYYEIIIIFCIKYFVALFFIISGSYCMATSECLFSNKINAGLFGIGLGIFFSTFITGLILVFWCFLKKLTIYDLKIYYYLTIKIFITSLFSFASVFIFDQITKIIMISIGCGNLFSSILTSIFFAILTSNNDQLLL